MKKRIITVLLAATLLMTACTETAKSSDKETAVKEQVTTTTTAARTRGTRLIPMHKTAPKILRLAEDFFALRGNISRNANKADDLNVILFSDLFNLPVFDCISDRTFFCKFYIVSNKYESFFIFIRHRKKQIAD